MLSTGRRWWWSCCCIICSRSKAGRWRWELSGNRSSCNAQVWQIVTNCDNWLPKCRSLFLVRVRVLFRTSWHLFYAHIWLSIDACISTAGHHSQVWSGHVFLATDTKTTVAYLTLPSLTSLCGRWAWTPAWSRLELRCGAVCTGNDGLQQVWWMHDFYGLQIDGFLPLLKSLKSLYFPKVKGPAVWFPKLSFLALASAGHRVRDGETGHWCRWWAFPGQRSDGQWNGSFAWLEWILEQRTSTMTVVSYR